MKFDSEKLEIKTFLAGEVPTGWSVLDIGPEDARKIMRKVLEGTRTIIYNGAVGLYENSLFAGGTKSAILSLEEFKRKNPEAKIVVLGGDGTTVLVEYLGEERMKEVAYLSSEMGGAGWKYFLGNSLSALNYVHRKNSDLEENNIDGVIDYSNLGDVSNLPSWYWRDKLLVDALVIADLNIGKTANITEEELLKLQKIKTIIGVIKDLWKRMGKGRKMIIITHNGRYKDYHKKLKVTPPDGTIDSDYSIQPIAEILTVLLRKEKVFDETEEVTFVPYTVLSETVFEKPEIKDGNVILFENPRFWKDETSKDKDAALEHAKKIWRAVKSVGYPTLCVQTAMGALHRGGQASRGLIIQFVMGPKVVSIPVKEELAKLHKISANPERPVVAIISGNKKEKIEDVIYYLIKQRKVNKIFIGGKIAMPFINKESLVLEIMKLAEENGIEIFLPEKVVAARIPEGITEEKLISILKKQRKPLLLFFIQFFRNCVCKLFMAITTQRRSK